MVNADGAYAGAISTVAFVVVGIVARAGEIIQYDGVQRSVKTIRAVLKTVANWPATHCCLLDEGDCKC